jgi:uncharacterized protein YjiS (DUF1127 family)
MMLRRWTSPDATDLPDRLARFAAPGRQRPATALERLVIDRLGPDAALPFLWLRRWRDRHELADLDDAQLRDVGLNAETVRRESAKPFWQA